jgi:hypothetical protein
VFGIQLKRHGPSFLPPSLSRGGCHIRCRCVPAGTPIPTKSEDEADEVEDEQWWAEAIAVADKSEREMTPLPLASHDIHRTSTLVSPFSPCGNRILSAKQRAPDLFHSPLAATTHNVLGGALISIGPQMDAVMDCYHLDDALLRQLRILTTTVRSSRWEVALRSAPWGLTHEQALNLSNAMNADIKNETFVQSKVRSNNGGYLHACVDRCSTSSPAAQDSFLGF